MANIDLPAGDESESRRMWSLRPDFGAAVTAFGDAIQNGSILPVRESEAARIRIAHINQCIPCSGARMEDMARFGLTDAFYDNVDDPALRSQYSPREQLAIGFAERFAEGVAAFDDVFWERMNAAFSRAEIVDLAACVAKWMGIGRVNAVLGIEALCPIVIAAPRERAA